MSNRHHHRYRTFQRNSNPLDFKATTSDPALLQSTLSPPSPTDNNIKTPPLPPSSSSSSCSSSVVPTVKPQRHSHQPHQQRQHNHHSNQNVLPLVISSFTRPARPPPTLNPQRLTIYTEAGIPQILGRGTFGVVYPGMLDSVCPVAVKHLCPRALHTSVSRESARDAASRHARLAKLQFRREIRRYAALRTVPGVVRFYGLVGKDKFVIERLFGGALNTVMRPSDNESHLLRKRCVLRLGYMIANAVADLHRRGMSHGDLKPSNILLSVPLQRFGGIVTDDVHIKLVDFGLSRRFHPLDGDDDDYHEEEDDDEDDIDGGGFDTDDFERLSVANSSTSAHKVTQSVQLAARRYSCPISRPYGTEENSDVDISDDDNNDDNNTVADDGRHSKKNKDLQQLSSRRHRRRLRNRHHEHHYEHSLSSEKSAKEEEEEEEEEEEGEEEVKEQKDDDDLVNKNNDEDDEDDDDDEINPHHLNAYPKDARGTPAYLSPEGWCGPSALKRRHVALKADVYALAMILYELETGMVPWDGMSEWSIFVEVSNKSQRPSWPSSSPSSRVPGLRNVIEACWQQNYRARPTCRQLARRLQELLNDMGNINEDEHANNEGMKIKNQNGTRGNVKNNSGVQQGIAIDDDMNQVEYTTPPVSSNSLVSSTTTTTTTTNTNITIGAATTASTTASAATNLNIANNIANSNDITFEQQQQQQQREQQQQQQQQQNISSLTPPSSPARTSSHPSPGIHILRHSNTSNNSGTASIHQTPNFPMSTQPLFEPQQQSSSAFSRDMNNSTSSTAPPSAVPVPHKFLDNPSSVTANNNSNNNNNNTPAVMTPSARQQRNEAMKPRSSTTSTATTTPTKPTGKSSTSVPSSDPASSSTSAPTSTAAPVRSLEYPYKDLVVRDDCAALCALVSQHNRNQKEVTAVLEALGALLDNSPTNCLLVANGTTLSVLATILSRYGPNDSRLCKSVCVIILRLALSGNAVIEMRLRVASACDMVLNCMRWHAANLPVIQNGACTLNALCRLSSALCSIFVSQGGANAALRALARASKTFNKDVLVASVALLVLSATAREYGHALLCDDILSGIFLHCESFKHGRIDERFIDVIHTLLRGLSEARDKIVAIPDCFIVFSNIIDRTRGEASWVPLFQYTCEIVSDLCRSGLRGETTTAVLKSHIVEATVESLNKLCERDSTSGTHRNNQYHHSNGHATNHHSSDTSGIGMNEGAAPNSSSTFMGDTSSSAEVLYDASAVGPDSKAASVQNNSSNKNNGAGESTDAVTDVSAGAAGLLSLFHLSSLGADVLGSFQMCNVFDMTRRFVKRAPNNHAVAYHVALLLISVLQKKNGASLITNKDLVYDMLVEMKEKWRHDTLVVEKVSRAMQLIHPSTNASMNGVNENNGVGGGGGGGINTEYVDGFQQQHHQAHHKLGMKHKRHHQDTGNGTTNSGRNGRNGVEQSNGNANSNHLHSGKQVVKEKGGWLWRRKGRAN